MLLPAALVAACAMALVQCVPVERQKGEERYTTTEEYPITTSITWTQMAAPEMDADGSASERAPTMQTRTRRRSWPSSAGGYFTISASDFVAYTWDLDDYEEIRLARHLSQYYYHCQSVWSYHCDGGEERIITLGLDNDNSDAELITFTGHWEHPAYTRVWECRSVRKVTLPGQPNQHENKVDDKEGETRVKFCWREFAAEMHMGYVVQMNCSSTGEEKAEAVFTRETCGPMYNFSRYQPHLRWSGTEWEGRKAAGWTWQPSMASEQMQLTNFVSFYYRTKNVNYTTRSRKRNCSKNGRLARGCFETLSAKNIGITSLLLYFVLLGDVERRQKLKSHLASACSGASVLQLIRTAVKGQSYIEKWRNDFKGHTPIWKKFDNFIPRPPVHWRVAPATSFLPEIGASSKDNMAHLGCRLASLAALPPSCNVSRTRLAQAGFYYDSSKVTRDGNNAHEVVCFSCGIAVARWEAGDNPMVVHRRLKPDCAHILSQGPDVFPSDPTPSFPGSGPSSISSLSTFSTDSSLSSLSSMSSWSSTSSISSDSSQASSVLGRAGSQEGAQSSGYSDLATDCAAIAPSPLAPDHVTAPRQYAPSRQAHSSFPSRITRNLNSPDDTDDRPQLSMDSAVYPQFSTISERLATYQGWPLGRYFKPDDLVYDGFYYAGYADCLRCFYCGVGLKSWDRNDSVMDEHIRWRPTCGYILAVKGRRFVNQTLQRLRANVPDADGELTTTQSNRDFVDRARNGPLVPSSSLSGNGSGQESHSTQGNTSSNEAVEAARVMGFSEDVIARALRDLQQPDASTIDKQTFIEYVVSLTTVVDGNETSTTAAGANETSDLNTDGPGAVAAAEPLSGRAQEVVRENERLRSMKTCKICNTGTVGVIFLPCGHLVACTDCAGRTRNCTRCGQYIRATANVYLS